MDIEMFNQIHFYLDGYMDEQIDGQIYSIELHIKIN